MGTRNLTIVITEGRMKVCQYGQWSGSPKDSGARILEFLHTCDLQHFKKQVDKVRYITDAEIEEVEQDDAWADKYPYLSRNAGSKVLAMLYNGNVKFLFNDEEFISDANNEWTYVIDLDSNTFEVYSTVRGEGIKEGERFYMYKGEDLGLRLLKTYSLLELPTYELFLAFFDGTDGTDEDAY